MTNWLWFRRTSSESTARRRRKILVLLTILFSQNIRGIFGKLQLCEVETGQTNIILDIEESRGSLIDQRTTPPVLPIYGDPYEEISLELVFPKGEPIFTLNDKSLQLLKSLDRDEDNLSHIMFQVICTIRKNGRKRNIPIIVRVSDVNDNSPVFMSTPYETTVPESTPVGTTIFNKILAQDKDAGVNGLVEYFLIESPQNISDITPDTLTASDGYGVFAIAYPHQGQVTLVKTLDYEKIQRYYLTIVASDRARNVHERLSSTTTLVVNVEDSDDLDPSFIYRGCILLEGACINPEYEVTLPTGSLHESLNVQPERIQAIDLDSISAPIKYSFINGLPGNFRDYFEIDEQTGVLKQIKIVENSIPTRKFDILVRAEEESENRRYTTAKLTIHVKPVDVYPPVINITSNDGFVDENSEIGTPVLDSKGRPIRLTTSDPDISEGGELPQYIYELTTSSFSVTGDGILRVNEGDLDKDPPSVGKFMFQIVARESNGNAASAPMSVNVTLNDVNDNPPILPIIPPVTMHAGDGQRPVTKVTATDNDSGKNAVPRYSIFHVTNNGANKFVINENTGELTTNGRLNAGENYSITVQATDIGGLSSKAIVEAVIIAGPNTKPPKFTKAVYDVQVSEGAEINSTVIVVKAEDPENEPVRYSITSGNDLRQFSVGHNTGVLSVIRKLDREDLTRYQLIIKAEDTGGLSSTATVNIKVTDINDKNPEFYDNYNFTVVEGKEDEFVGKVHAIDADEGKNADISYSIPFDVPFKIDSQTGEIRTKAKLDYETQYEFKFVVTAKDDATDPRFGTASVTITVKDVQDETPKFLDSLMEIKVPENVPDLVITTVKAYDLDTVPQIKYTIKSGPKDLFEINPITGQLKTVKGLDYEIEKVYELIVGTLENDGNSPGDYVKVLVEVEDRNDNPPVFENNPEIVSISDDQLVGSIVGSMLATDADGSSPSNVVRYEIIGRGKALKYFQIDPDSGMIRIRDDLSKETDVQYFVEVKAYDMGEPQLSTVAVLPINVKHIPQSDNETNEVKTDVSVPILNLDMQGLAFDEETYTTGVPESTGINATIKLIQIVNSRKTKLTDGFKCEIVTGNDLKLFRMTTEEHACGLVLVAPLDYEHRKSHTLELKLTSDKYFVNEDRNMAKVKVIVQDENDNRPEFVFPKNYQKTGKNNTFYGVVSNDAEIDTLVMQIRATDKDSGRYGMLKYFIFDEENNNISNDDLPSSFFAISEENGMLKVNKGFQKSKHQIFKFFVEVRDNTGNLEGPVHKTRARIVVNLIDDANRLSLVFENASPREIKRHEKALEELLYEKSDGLLVGVESYSSRKTIKENGTIRLIPKATDVWFYAIDPITETILERNSSLVMYNIMMPKIQTEISFTASSITRANALGIYEPIATKGSDVDQKIKTAVIINEDTMPYILTAIAIIVLILGIIGIAYICVTWSRYKSFKQNTSRQYNGSNNPVAFDPVIMNSQSNNATENHQHHQPALKEYETQVLAVTNTINIDEGRCSPTNSEATTANVETLQWNNNNMNNTKKNNYNSISRNISNNHHYYHHQHNATLKVNRNNYLNPLVMANNGTLTLGRIKAERNHYINGYGETLNRNNLRMTTNNTLGRPRRNYDNNEISTNL